MSRAGRGAGLFLALCLAAAMLFAGLGVWQLERRAWKLDLIEKVEARRHAPPIPSPPSRSWPGFDATASEYRQVVAEGRFLHDLETRVDALTELGAGDWIMTPLQTGDGVVLINRGFVPARTDGAATPTLERPTGTVRVVGLLRASEPDGRILRPNQPAQNRWYSRDVAAIARARGVGAVAPFFIDAGAAPGSGGWPKGGMTVVVFRNTHLAYALTWFALAALAIVGAVLVYRSRRSDP